MARKIVVQEFITLDGVMQAPGESKEDEAEGFKYGGWTAPFFKVADMEGGDFMKRWMESTDILLGKKTFEIFSGYWPKHAEMWPGINDVTKYIASTTMTQSDVDVLGLGQLSVAHRRRRHQKAEEIKRFCYQGPWQRQPCPDVIPA